MLLHFCDGQDGATEIFRPRPPLYHALIVANGTVITCNNHNNHCL